MNRQLGFKITSIFLAFAFVFVLLPVLVSAQQATSAATRMNELGRENSQMARRVGIWDVIETTWASPEDAKPTTQKLVAERKMIGSFLQEILAPTANAAAADILRIDYLSFNRVEGRWKYISMETRAPVGMMPAVSEEPGENGTITFTFEPFAITGNGADVTGQMLRMKQIITQKDADHDQKDQYFAPAGGDGKMRLGHRYEYVRRGTKSK